MKEKETSKQLHLPDILTKIQDYLSNFEELRGFL